MKTNVLLACAVALSLAAFFALPDQAAESPSTGQVVHAKAQKGRGAAKDENIKTEQAPKNPTSGGPPAPPNKGGDKSRGRYCVIHIDNHTRLWIRVFIDGNYMGTVPPWGDIYPITLSGPTRLYARADYDDGTYSYWGPRTVVCEDTYTWQLDD